MLGYKRTNSTPRRHDQAPFSKDRKAQQEQGEHRESAHRNPQLHRRGGPEARSVLLHERLRSGPRTSHTQHFGIADPGLLAMEPRIAGLLSFYFYLTQTLFIYTL